MKIEELAKNIKSPNVYFKSDHVLDEENDIYVYAILAAEINGKSINDWAYSICGSADDRVEYSEEEMARFRSGDYTLAEMIENAIKDLVFRVSGYHECATDPKARRENKRRNKEIDRAIEYIAKARQCLENAPLDETKWSLEFMQEDLKKYQERNVFTELGFRKAIYYPLAFLLSALDQFVSLQKFSNLVSEIIFNASGFTVESSVIYEHLRKIKRNPGNDDDKELCEMLEENSPLKWLAPGYYLGCDLTRECKKIFMQNPHKPASELLKTIRDEMDGHVGKGETPAGGMPCADDEPASGGG